MPAAICHSFSETNILFHYVLSQLVIFMKIANIFLFKVYLRFFVQNFKENRQDLLKLDLVKNPQPSHFFISQADASLKFIEETAFRHDQIISNM